MIVVLIIGILLAIAVPNFINARQQSRAATIIANLVELDAAKENCAMESGLNVGDDCANYPRYLKHYPVVMPMVGTLVEGPVGTYATFNGKTAEEWKADKNGL